MSSQIGQVCRTAAQKAVEMKSPCIQITPVYPNDLEEWARLYFYFSEMAKSVEKKVELPFIISIEETGSEEVQCNGSDNGFHEFMEFQNEAIKNPSMLCIHCGAFAPKTTRTKEELREFFEKKKFKRKEIPRANPEDLPF